MTYSREQIDQFLEHIELPQTLWHAQPSPGLLNALHVHTLAALSYENLSIHYNPTHTVLLDPQHLFQKIVVSKRGRGGYCMEIAILYNQILRGLGFDAYTAGVRTRTRVDGVPQGDYPGWIHIVNIVNFEDGSKYHDDVAFGGDGATMAMPLVDGLVHRNMGSQEIRLVRDWISTQTRRTEEAKLWIYQYRNGADRDWNSFYAFPELEFMPADWEIVNWWTSASSRSWQTSTLLAIKFLRRTKSDGQPGIEEQEIYGKRMLVNGVVKENLGGKTTVIRAWKSEEERVRGLEEFFGIKLTEEEIGGIRGCIAELKDMTII